MAVLKHTASGTLHRIPPRAIVGRGARCDLRVDDRRCSTQHAELRWVDDRWVIRDLASRNGTWFEGRRLDVAEVRDLTAGLRLAFGNPPDTWEIVSVDAPVACARAPDGTLRFAEDDLLLLPSPDRPLIVLDRDDGGRWWIARDEGRVPCVAEHVEWIDEQLWEIQAPKADGGTALLDVRQNLSEATLTFHVSPNEEDVAIDIFAEGMLTRMESRAHNYLLVLLARRRLADEASGMDAKTAGWMHLADEVAPMLATSSNDVNVQVFRARQQLKEQDVDGAARIVERKSGRLRIGVSSVQVIRHEIWPPAPLR